MKGNLFLQNRKKKIIAVAVVLTVMLVLGGGSIFFALRGGNQTELPLGQGGAGMGFAISGNAVKTTGVINMGVTEERFEVEDLSAELLVEEVYIASNQEIEAGTKILKMTEESIAAVRDELEKKLTEAELAYRAGAIEREQSKITAEYEYNSALLAGEQAEEVYEEALTGLKSSVERAEEELAEAQEQIAEYQSYVSDGSYKSYFKVDEYQALYDENLEVLIDKMDAWGVSWEQVTGGGMGPGGEYSYEGILSSLYKVLEQNLKDLEQAQSDYETAVDNAAFELQTLELELPTLRLAVEEAKETYEIQLGQAELSREKSKTGAEQAQRDYETALEKADADYETLKSDYEDAQSNLTLFENSMGDGYYYAAGSGTVLRTMVRAGQELRSESVIFMYSNPEEMSVTVSVDQTEIAKLTVGDEVYVQATMGDGYRGSITAINPVTASDSRTNITYSVTVTLSGDTSGLTANQSVTVLFGMNAEEIENKQTPKDGSAGGRGERQKDGSSGGERELPEGFPGGER